MKRNFLPQIGMMERWNDGIMGSMPRRRWSAGRIRDNWGTIELMGLQLPLKINIPIFHHSIFPCAMQKLKPHGLPFVVKK
jgi:hypothetical protein